MELTNQQQQAEADAELAAQIEAASRDELIGLIHTYRAEYTACKKQLDKSINRVLAQEATIREQANEIEEAEAACDRYDATIEEMEQEIEALKNGETLHALQKENILLQERNRELLALSQKEEPMEGEPYEPTAVEYEMAAERRAELHKRIQENAVETERKIRKEIEEIKAKIVQWQDSVEAQQEHLFRLEARFAELRAANRKRRTKREMEAGVELQDPTIEEITGLQDVKEELKKRREQVRVTVKEVRAQTAMKEEAERRLTRHLKRMTQANELYAKEQIKRVNSKPLD